MMPTAPPVHNGVYEAAPSCSGLPEQLVRADHLYGRRPRRRGPGSFGPRRGNRSVELSECRSPRRGAAYPNTAANAYANPTSNNFPPGGSQPNTSPSNAYPPNNYSPNNYPPSGYPPRGHSIERLSSQHQSAGNSSPTGYPANASPSNGYSAGVCPSARLSGQRHPEQRLSSGGYPSRGYPANASLKQHPFGGYPSTGYPANASPTNGSPTAIGQRHPEPALRPTAIRPAAIHRPAILRRGYPSGGYPSNNYPSNNANVPYPGTERPGGRSDDQWGCRLLWRHGRSGKSTIRRGN